jgi:hypothetical protein
MTRPQLDLFASHRPTREQGSSPALVQPPADFIARIRGELEATLRIAREATTLPWPDLTHATLVELRFHSIARWLPADEATALTAAFEVEMARLYEREEDGAG